MKRSSNKKIFSCPICSRKPYVKYYDSDYARIYCRGVIFNRHHLIEVEVQEQPSILEEAIVVAWNEKRRQYYV